MRARGCCQRRERANKTVRSKVRTAIDVELMQKGKQIQSQDRCSERFIIAQTLQPLSPFVLFGHRR